ncbi:unannotated protein [freshwater metagenome]|uniref:Unannotated protein n=1 Tax=freshwater metagenome TaxID=449393 RepID=A0A6J6XQ79_9ZZZZ|nr:hypothetical protein [Actinomycetota bacterium]MSX82031.1 hypothetical protein [Actinomycetota bacterium]
MSQIPPPPPPPGFNPPPPPPPPGAMSSGAGFTPGAAISYAWNATMKNLGPLVLMTLVILVAQVVIQVGFSGGRGVVALLLSIATSVVSLILAMGLIRAALRVTDGGTPELSQLTETDQLGPYIVQAILVGIAIGIGLVLCIIPGLIAAVLFAFAGYAVIDTRDGDAVGAIKRSFEIVKGNFGAVLGLIVLLMLINIAGAMLCGIGLLFTYPMTSVAIAYAYRTLNGQPVAAI